MGSEEALLTRVRHLVNLDPRILHILIAIVGQEKRYPLATIHGAPELGQRWWFPEVVTIRGMKLTGDHLRALCDKEILEVAVSQLGAAYRLKPGVEGEIEPILRSLWTPAVPGGATSPEEEEIEKIPPETIETFERLLKEGVDMVDFWAPKINPKVEGLIPVKRAILICLASSQDVAGDRGRSHVLMHGPPGTAKTMLRTWVASHLGAGSCSQRTTKVGLTGSASGGEITPGALPRNHRGVLTVDEGDKFPDSDRQGLLEAMEEGFVEIEAGGKSKRFPAEVRIILCANNIKNFSPELKDRFDFNFSMETPSGKEEKAVVQSIVRSWFRDKEWYDGRHLRHYLAWIKDYQPEISDQVRRFAEKLICACIDLEPANIPYVRGIRRREAVMRVAFTIARLNRRALNVDDVLRAIIYLEGVQSDSEFVSGLRKVAAATDAEV